ncbi:MAG: FHA domain-containing protein [Clostridium sp.]|nr:FHA domain-containing protein [Acetatifactor muris]MCM1527801.1 FHA domain-containing protein [Bacteroides sp.]MCM1563896.1 FHA domain-containing protein [Clostridium sp.]
MTCHRLYMPDGRVAARLEKDIFVIGKQKDEVDLVLEDDSVSRLHARICREDETVYLEDLNSTNGTFKNGLRLQPYEKRRLQEGDEIRFGKLLFVYR